MSAKQRILTAMYSLLEEKTIDRISIEMILTRSDVSKATFYRHFKDKYDLMNWYYKENVSKVFVESADGPWIETSKRIIDFLHSNKKYFANAFKAEGQNSFQNFLTDYTKEFCEEAYKRNKGVKNITSRERLQIGHYSTGSIHVAQQWLSGEVDYSVEELAEILCSCVPNELQAYLH